MKNKNSCYGVITNISINKNISGFPIYHIIAETIEENDFFDNTISFYLPNAYPYNILKIGNVILINEIFDCHSMVPYYEIDSQKKELIKKL